jgi:hypothetical protein
MLFSISRDSFWKYLQVNLIIRLIWYYNIYATIAGGAYFYFESYGDWPIDRHVMPDEMLARLKVVKGDTLYATETDGGGFQITAFAPEFAAKMAKAENIMDRYRNALQVLPQ